ncbi:hypothetical protein BV25DRAFT_1868065 [Artomyces pyxidatus]|uniref:Uncharacterized protein n=1 Tax=Artomyces pyxidatus TaxID=48021 RepID=A0ACB8TF18_9AGAM|nr:hypothetical protein BV25DRAFT_1868065 [Artomyces pyxidatus]
MSATSTILRPILAAAAAAPPVNSDRIVRKRLATEYTKEVWYFIGCFIFLVVVSNIVSILSGLGRRRKVLRKDAEGQQARSGALSLRRLPLAIVNAWRVVAFRSVIDLGKGYSINIAELFTTVAYITILFTWTMVKTTTLKGHKLDITYWSGRAGDIAAVQMPLIVALGMRNNIIAFITGISFEKLNYLHRMCARTVCVLLWVHAGGKLTFFPISVSFDENFIQLGLLALTAFSILFLVSIRPVRQLGYEFFVIAHFCLILIMLLGAYFHTKRFEADHYIWPSFLLWGIDRAIRIIRLVTFNHSYFGFSTGLGTFNATADVVAPGFVRLRFRRPNHLHWAPGQSAFLTMPGVSAIPFESHPFTIANADLAHLHHNEAADFNEKASNNSSNSAPASHGKDIVFVVKAREGFTKRLNQIAKTDGTLKIFVDGPYGAPPNLSQFDTVVFFAGGSGVTFTNPLFVDLLHRARVEAAAARNIIFHINLVYQDLLDSLRQELPGVNVDVRIHVTTTDVDHLRASSEASSESVGSCSKYSQDATKISQLPRTRVEYCRPNVQTIIEEAASLAAGNMAVNVCGPAALSADVRRALRSPAAGPMSVLRGGPSISLFVEAFGYAVSLPSP